MRLQNETDTHVAGAIIDAHDAIHDRCGGDLGAVEIEVCGNSKSPIESCSADRIIWGCGCACPRSLVSSSCSLNTQRNSRKPDCKLPYSAFPRLTQRKKMSQHRQLPWSWEANALRYCSQMCVSRRYTAVSNKESKLPLQPPPWRADAIFG